MYLFKFPTVFAQIPKKYFQLKTWFCVAVVPFFSVSLDRVTSPNVFVPIVNCICSNSKLYLFKLQKKQARKPRSYVSLKLRPLTYSLTGVRCRATSVAKNSIESLVLCSRCSFLLGLSGPCDIAKLTRRRTPQCSYKQSQQKQTFKM